MAELPLVSVVIPTRNRARLLQRAIASVFAQTHRRWELIVINDASTDQTRELLDGLSDGRVRIIHRERNEGASAARNLGIHDATGEYVAFLDDDDWWLPEKLARQVAQLRQSARPWCISGFMRKHAGGQQTYIGGAQYLQQLDFACGVGEQGHDWSLIATPGWLVHRTTLLALGVFDERIRNYEDWELGIRLAGAGGFDFIDEPLWVQDASFGRGLTYAWKERADGLRRIMEKHGALWSARRDVQALHWYIIGRIESLHCPAPAGRVELLRALRLRPWSPRAWVALAASLLGSRWNNRVTGWVLRLERATRRRLGLRPRSAAIQPA